MCAPIGGRYDGSGTPDVMRPIVPVRHLARTATAEVHKRYGT